MINPTVSIVRTGVANTASIRAAFARLGSDAEVVETPEAIESAALLVLPGVGAFAAGMRRLRERDLVAPLQRRIAEGRPTLAVCLGMQMLFDASDESPDVEGLGVAPGVARPFPSGVRAPQMGWNRIEPIDPSDPILQPGYAYFANSYRLTEAPPGWSVAMADHAGPFVAAMRRRSVFACQFHPELSGDLGLDLLRRWIAQSAAKAPQRRNGAASSC